MSQSRPRIFSRDVNALTEEEKKKMEIADKPAQSGAPIMSRFLKFCCCVIPVEEDEEMPCLNKKMDQGLG